jgi:N-acetylglucosamine transport system permease protein
MRLVLAFGKYALLALYIVIVAFPIVWMGVSSFKTTREIQNAPWSLPKELADRIGPLDTAARDLRDGLRRLPASFPTDPAVALAAADELDALAKDPVVRQGRDGIIVDDPGGPLGRVRMYASEMRESGKFGARSQRFARNLRAYADALGTDPSRATTLQERLSADYNTLRGDLSALADQIEGKARQGVFGNYAEAWTTTQIGKAFFNSLIVSLATMVVLIPISAMAAYVLAKYRFRGSNALFMLFLGGMMFPQFLVIVPLFLQMSGLGLDDSLTGLTLVYIAFSLPFTVFVLTGFFHQLPDELAEAAMLDGCGHQATFWKIMMPLAKPGLVVVTIFDVIGLWNEYNLALVLMRTRDSFTLPRALDSLQMTAQYLGDTGALMAAMVIVILPVLVVYWLLKEKIHEAMLAGAVKG